MKMGRVDDPLSEASIGFFVDNNHVWGIPSPMRRGDDAAFDPVMDDPEAHAIFFTNLTNIQGPWRRNSVSSKTSARVSGSRHVRCDGRLFGGRLCLTWSEPAQGGQSRPVDRDPAGPFGTSWPIWRAQNLRGLALGGARGEPQPR
jgi:hypothetical protein